MGFLDWIMKGIGFDSNEDEDSLIEKEQKKSKKQKKKDKNQDLTNQKIETKSNFGRPVFDSAVDEVFSESGNIAHEAEPTTFGGNYESSVGGYGSKNFVFFKPKSYDDVRSLINFMKQGEPAIINLDDVSESEAQRMLDFISGAVSALSGNIQRISGNIFLIAPEGFNIKLPQNPQ